MPPATEAVKCYRVDMPGQTARLNQLIGCHWATKHRRTKADRQLVGYCCHHAGVPPATGKRRVKLTVVLGPRQRGPDPDAFWKSLLDALVACGALRGDSKEWVELPPVAYQRGRARSMHLILEDIP